MPREVKSKVRKPDHATAYLMWEVDCAVCWNIDQYREDDLPENCEQCGAPIFVGLG